MYFNNKIDTNINKEFDKKRKFNIKEYMWLFKTIVLMIFFLSISIILIRKRNKNNNYNLSLYGEETLIIYKDNEYVEPGYVGKDKKGNDITYQVNVNSNVNTLIIGEYEIIYTLGNITKKRYVSVVDKPIGATSIYLKGDNVIYLNVSSQYIEPGYIVIDSIDSNITDKVVIDHNIDTSKSGTYRVVYSVTNSTGVTTQAKRTVIVSDSELLLSLDSDNYTNNDVSINVYVNDNYFDYLILPDGSKINDKKYSYKVSNNGEYKFISYNKNGLKKESIIKVNNIDREKPQGTCSGTYDDSSTKINVNATDNVMVGGYIIDGKSYVDNNIVLNKSLSSFRVIIYDKAGNQETISCDMKRVENSNPVVKPETKKGLEIHFIASGAYDDAILIKTNDKVIFIDGGDWGCRKYVVPYLKQVGITKIDVMIGSHLHRNHIATQADIMDNFEVGNIYYPDDIYTCYQRGSCVKSSQEYIIDGLSRNNKTPIVLTAPKKITVGDIELYFIAPHRIITGTSYPENMNSFIFILKYYNNSFMFTGDSGTDNMNATKLKEKANALGVSLDVDLFKYPHHGNSPLTDSFLSTIKAEYVIVPNYLSSKFPYSENRNMLSKYGVVMYRQSDSSTGNILIRSDGTNINIQNNYSLS